MFKHLFKCGNRLQGTLSVLVCMLWQVYPVQGQTVPCNAATSQATSVSGLCVGCYVENPTLAVDTDTATFSTLRVTLGLLGGYVEQKLNFPTISQPGDSVRLFLNFPVGLLDLSLLGSIQVATYNGDVYNNDRQVINGELLTIRLITQQQALISWVPVNLFNKVEVRLNSGLLQLLNTVNINYIHKVVPAPTITTTTNSICSGETIQLNATVPPGATVHWYNQPSGGSALATGNNFNVLAVPGNSFYYAQAERSGCINPQRAVATVSGRILPAEPVILNPSDSICNNTIASFSASQSPGNVTKWYNQTVGGNLLFSGPTFTTPILNTTTTYYAATQDSTGCISQLRTKVTAHVLPPGPGISLAGTKSFGGTGKDIFNAIVYTTDKGYFAGGSSTSKDGDLPLNNNGMDFWAVKFDSTGNKVWSKTYGSSTTDSLTSVASTSDGKLILCGNYNTGTAAVSGKILGLDTNGNQLWSQSTKYYNQYAKASNREKAIIVIGSDGTKLQLTEWSSTGILLRSAVYNGSYTPDQLSFIRIPGKHILIAGSVNNGNSYGKDLFILNIDSNLNRVWEKVFLGLGNDVGVDVTAAPDGKFSITHVTITSDSLPATIKVLKLNTQGELIFIKEISPTNPVPKATGTAKWFSSAKGFGFITPDEGGQDMSVHRSEARLSGTRLSAWEGNSNPTARSNTVLTTTLSIILELDDQGNIVAQQTITPMIPKGSALTIDGGVFVAGSSPDTNGDAIIAKVASPSCLPASPPLTITDKTAGTQYKEIAPNSTKQPNEKPVFQVFPNPFNQTFVCRYEILHKESTQLRLISINGASNDLLKNEVTSPGIYNIQIDARAYNSGTYILQLLQGSKKRSIKLIKL